MVARRRRNVTLYVHYLSCFKFRSPVVHVFNSFHSHQNAALAQGLTYSGCQVVKAPRIFRNTDFNVGPMPAFTFMENPIKQWLE
jgi:hypothetical protein